MPPDLSHKIILIHTIQCCVVAAGVWTAAIATFLGMSEAASSREVFTAVYSDGEMYERAARHGISLVGYDMFNWVRGDPLNSLSSWSGIVRASMALCLTMFRLADAVERAQSVWLPILR